MMRSLQVALVYQDQPEQIARYSELQVLCSRAGYYIGTTYQNSDGYQEPGSRDSDYYSTKERADYAFRYLENLWILCKDEMSEAEIVNKWAKQMRTLGYDPRMVGYRFTP